MNIQELQLVLETVKTVSGYASTVAVWWIIGNYVLNFIVQMSIVVAVSFVATKIVKLIMSTNEWGEAGKSVAKAWGSGGGDWYYQADSEAIEKAINAARKGK